MYVCVNGGRGWGGAVKALMCAPCAPQAFPFVVPEPEGLRLGQSQGSRYTTFLSHYSRRLFTSSTILGFGWPFLSPLMSCVFILVIIFWLLAAPAAEAKHGAMSVRAGGKEGQEIEGLLLLQRLSVCALECVCVLLNVCHLILKLHLDKIPTTRVSRSYKVKENSYPHVYLYSCYMHYKQDIML